MKTLINLFLSFFSIGILVLMVALAVWVSL